MLCPAAHIYDVIAAHQFRRGQGFLSLRLKDENLHSHIEWPRASWRVNLGTAC